MQDNDAMPNWDIAISGMVENEHSTKQRALTMADFKYLAKEYDFRLDDIMETLFLMVMHQAWKYTPDTSDTKSLNHEVLIEYCTKKRLNDEDLNAFNGQWLPLKS
jgi:hypothetical protein